SGAAVKAGDLLAQLDTAAEAAQLRAAEAELALARTSLDRISQLLAKTSVSRSELDAAEARFKAAAAQRDAIQVAIAKKAIVAPFAGRLGIRQVSLGQILAEGDPVVSLVALDPIHVDFQLPQGQLPQIRVGLAVGIVADAFPGEEAEGRITAVSAQVDAATRNITAQATLPNPGERWRPGMSVQVAMHLPGAEEVLVIPATAVLYAPYSDSVFVVEEKVDVSTGAKALSVRQQFVRLGRKKGDFVAVASGLAAGDTVVATGVFKLRNGQAVVKDNTLLPSFQLAPDPANS
ncbi:MAG: efflux RND transporter periplasmic adaptor subunit, partial [Thermodesulfobacteriota bacterium]